MEDDGSVVEPSTETKWRTFAAFQSEYLDQAKRSCMKYGAHVGSNPTAKKQALIDITAFLQKRGFFQ